MDTALFAMFGVAGVLTFAAAVVPKMLAPPPKPTARKLAPCDVKLTPDDEATVATLLQPSGTAADPSKLQDYRHDYGLLLAAVGTSSSSTVKVAALQKWAIETGGSDPKRP